MQSKHKRFIDRYDQHASLESDLHRTPFIEGGRNQLLAIELVGAVAQIDLGTGAIDRRADDMQLPILVESKLKHHWTELGIANPALPSAKKIGRPIR
jgi:hypothetical protein